MVTYTGFYPHPSRFFYLTFTHSFPGCYSDVKWLHSAAPYQSGGLLLQPVSYIVLHDMFKTLAHKAAIMLACTTVLGVVQKENIESFTRWILFKLYTVDHKQHPESWHQLIWPFYSSSITVCGSLITLWVQQPPPFLKNKIPVSKMWGLNKIL